MSIYKKPCDEITVSQLYSSKVVLKNTAEAVIVPLKGDISSMNEVYQALIKADVDPVTGQCSNYEYIRQQIVQAHQLLEQSEQMASSGLKSLDENLERLTQHEGKLKREMNDTKQTLTKLRTEQASSEKLLRESQGDLELARTNLNSTKRILQKQKRRKQKAELVSDVGAILFPIPIIGWIAGSGMLIGGEIAMVKAKNVIKLAKKEASKSEKEVVKYEHKVSDYKSRISQTKRYASQKDEKLKQTCEGIQKVKKQVESVADFQNKVRSAVPLLGVLSGRASVAEHQTRRFILQEPVRKVMEDVMRATEQITGNKVLYDNDMPRLLDQMKQNSQRMAAICASEDSSNYT